MQFFDENEECSLYDKGPTLGPLKHPLTCALAVILREGRQRYLLDSERSLGDINESSRLMVIHPLLSWWLVEAAGSLY